MNTAVSPINPSSTSTPLAVRAVFIDLDGTLLDTAEDLCVAANAMLRALDRPSVDVECIRRYIGRGLANLVKRCLAGRRELSPEEESAAVPAEAMALFRQHYAQANGQQARLYPGVKEGLDALRAQQLPLVCITNKASDFTLPLLERSGLANYFTDVISGDSLAKAKPDPLPVFEACRRLNIPTQQALLIGDSINDVRAARAAGCHIFCVPYGYNEGQDVRDLDCDAIVPTLVAAAQRVLRTEC